MIKTLSIIIIIGIIAIAGWAVGIKTFKFRQENNNSNASQNEEKNIFTPKKDALIYTIQTESAITLYGVYPGITNTDDEMLTSLASFYVYDLTQKNSIPTFTIKENSIIRSANNEGDVNKIITLNGKEVNYASSENHDPFKEDAIIIYSSDKSLSSESLPITQTTIHIKGKKNISITINKLPHEMQSMRPVGFSSDNSKLYIIADAIQDEKGDRSGLYEYVVASGEVKEIQYSGDLSDVSGMNKEATFLAFDPAGNFIYFLNKGTKDREKITRMEIATDKYNDVLTDLPIASWQIHFINKGSGLIIDDLQGQANIYFVDLENNKTNKLPMIGSFLDVLSSGNSFIYSKDSYSTDNTANVNMQYSIKEYHLYNIDNGKDSSALSIANSIKKNGIETISDKMTVLGILRLE